VATHRVWQDGCSGLITRIESLGEGESTYPSSQLNYMTKQICPHGPRVGVEYLFQTKSTLQARRTKKTKQEVKLNNIPITCRERWIKEMENRANKGR
jgi:hypothetical protein